MTKELYSSTPKLRFAPSPTGYLHIGGARTALFNYLWARKTGGKFLLRIEDTDIKREKEDSITRIVEDLQWLGITWDEGPIRQTERIPIYQKYARELEQKGLAYPCYCTPEELRKKREDRHDTTISQKYDGTCANLTPEERKQKEAEGRKPALRFKMPRENIAVHDLIRGDVVYDKESAGDFIILKSDGIPSYNFAVVIDDHEMGITLVMRGEEHLVNTPRQIALYSALGFPIPQFAHISMILSSEREKLSKRHGTVAVDLFRKEGYLPEALVNYIALLGWSPPGDREFFTLEEMISAFSLDRLAKNPAVYDVEKLKWMNSQYIQKKDNDTLLDHIAPYLKDVGYIDDHLLKTDRERLIRMVEALKPRLNLLSDVVKEARVFFDDNIEFDESAKECLAWETTPKVFDAFQMVLNEYDALTPDNFMEAVKKIQKLSGAKGKYLYMPLRVCVTGQAHGPEMAQILTILTKEQMSRRIEVSKTKIASAIDRNQDIDIQADE